MDKIDSITTEELFLALGDGEFLNKLETAINDRVSHYYKWCDSSEDDSDLQKKFYKKTKAVISLRREINKYINAMDI